MTHVYVLTVNNIEEDAGNVHTSVYTTREKAFAFLAAHCRGDWESQGREGRLSADDVQAVNRYFAYWSCEMTWGISRKTVDQDPATVEQSAEFAAGKAADEFFDEEQTP